MIRILLTGFSVICIALIISITACSSLGKAPKGKRLIRIKHSTNYKEGKFQNIHPAAMISEGYTMSVEIYRTLIKKNPRKQPDDVIPSVKTNLSVLSPDRNIMIWFGHSSYFLQVDGKRILVDPVFSGRATPLPFGVKAFKGTDIYTTDDMPDIDYLIITHDHYDHLDYKTVKDLNSKVKHVICGLGVGQHFESWGYNPEKIFEKDWNETIDITDNFKVHTATAKHFSGRGFSSGNTLWVSYILETSSLKIYLGGDSGYDTHFAEIGEKYGPIDLAILDNGQYNIAFRSIHLSPKDVIQATKDLKAKRLFPVHSSKFALERHPWDMPLINTTELGEKNHLILVTPLIGEVVYLNDNTQKFKHWWKEVN